MENQNQNENQNTEQPNDAQAPKEGIILAGPTKKCPYCGEELPEKIAFCLYCMKSLIGDPEQKTEGAYQGNENKEEKHTKKSSMKTWVKVLIGVAAAFVFFTTIAVTVAVTAFVVTRQYNRLNHNRQPVTVATRTAPEREINWQQEDNRRNGGDNRQGDDNRRNDGDNRQDDDNRRNGEENRRDDDDRQQADNQQGDISQDSAGLFDHITPRAPARQGGPENPPISAIRAVELAHDYLLSIGVTNARFEYVYMDREDGFWVWSVEFEDRDRDRDYEFYVDVETGAFIEAPRSHSIYHNWSVGRNWHDGHSRHYGRRTGICRNFPEGYPDQLNHLNWMGGRRAAWCQ